jgi:hypothetical protein
VNLPEPGPDQRRVFLFTFPQLEEPNRRRAGAEQEELLMLLSRLTTEINSGWAYLPGLPIFDRMHKHTLQAALLARSFMSLSAAIDLAVRGYYVQAATLLRSLYENELILWASDVDPQSVEALYELHWPEGREYSFGALARNMDAALVDQGHVPRMAETWKRIYGTLSEIAHPRGRGLRMEFDETGGVLKTGPQWDSDYLMFALGISLLVAVRLALQQRDFLSRLGTPGREWLDRISGAIAHADDWLASNALREPESKAE